MRVEVNHAHFEALVRRVNFHRHDRDFHLVRDGFRCRQGELEALVGRVPTRPALGEALLSYVAVRWMRERILWPSEREPVDA